MNILLVAARRAAWQCVAWCGWLVPTRSELACPLPRLVLVDSVFWCGDARRPWP